MNECALKAGRVAQFNLLQMSCNVSPELNLRVPQLEQLAAFAERDMNGPA
jgi:hypothetical protein